MPSFCRPFGLGPKPAMTRPRTGHRKPGALPPASPAFAPVTSGATGAASRALCGDSAAATDPTVGSLRGAGGAAGADAEATGVDAPPGMVMRSPTLTIVSG